jgi:hypothetical protein
VHLAIPRLGAADDAGRARGGGGGGEGKLRLLGLSLGVLLTLEDERAAAVEIDAAGGDLASERWRRTARSKT